jgi:hypothetical protein
MHTLFLHESDPAILKLVWPCNDLAAEKIGRWQTVPGCLPKTLLLASMNLLLKLLSNAVVVSQNSFSKNQNQNKMCCYYSRHPICRAKCRGADGESGMGTGRPTGSMARMTRTPTAASDGDPPRRWNDAAMSWKNQESPPAVGWSSLLGWARLMGRSCLIFFYWGVKISRGM